MNLLLWILFLPLAAFLAALAIPRSSANASRMWALVASLGIFLLSVGLVFSFDRNVTGNQLGIDIPWIATPDIHFHIAADGISLWLVMLSTFLTPICVLISWNAHRPSRQRVLRLPAAAGIRPDRRLHRAGPVPVLRVLGNLPGAHVLPDRHLGP